ncbi:DNA polymerase III subunit alpha [Candidatus Carsonella ruddii]|uniref:DNA polymerase III subunit alpha n=1 Tax=Candidatus Carsonella ruddii HC isolate Thao2000 TaxID=1202538 RepID=J3TE68_CARRU|nr:DNA polymerase III subunit alpha [Candidatus Carsonella ruddii]AFP83877.1 DNA polymerase III alpha subunit [Candidatus Carsonella ruddii HC isolate Thao2000]
MINFTHLNLHSEYSFVDSIIKIGQIIDIYKKMNYKTICVTDLLTMSSFYEYYFYCYDNNIKSLIGIECFILINGNLLGVILLAKNFLGYKNLMQILSHAWRYGNIENGVFFKLHWIINYINNLIIIINPRYYILNKKNNSEKELLFTLKQLLFYFEKDIYFEYIKINLPFEKYINNKIFFYSKLLLIELVASNSVKFLFFEDYTASIGKVLLSQESFLNNEIFFEYTNEQYLKTYTQMKKLFLDNKKSINNISIIINDCNIKFKCYNFNLPNVKIKKFKVRKKIFFNLLKTGLKNRILKKKKNIIPYLNRINKEIIIVNKMGLLDYFLIIFEFMIWSKKKKIPSGPGRGSGASSLICYSLHITDIDPVNENLLFERFLTSERPSLPDLDLDFCVLERDSLIEHMFEYYDYINTAQIITFHNLSTKSLIRDLSRAIGMDYISGDRFSKSIPFSLELCMEDIFRKFLSVRSFISSNEKSLDIWKISTKIEGLYANISKHAGGVVICKNNLFNITPILFDNEDCVTQYEKTILQEIGLLKFDFLGLKTITLINLVLSMIPEKSTGEFNIDDFHTYQMINSLETDLVFQLESNGMKKMIKRCPIINIYDIIFYLSLFRPGPIQSGCVNIFLNRKNNLEKNYFPYKNYNYTFLKNFLYYTHGIIIFQEQVISIIQSIFESTMYDSEKIFRIMISNSFKELNILFEIFKKKCLKLKLNKKEYKNFFYLIVVFAGYSFNKTHAHSYSKIVYQTAFLKANYLLEFCISNIYVDQLLGLDLDRVIFNLKTIGIFFYKPDINLSDDNFKIYKNGILYGFSIVKFIDDDFIDRILYYRNKIFFFNNFETFCKIFSIFKIKNKKIIENLIFCGFFDCYRINRVFLYINFQFIYQKILILKSEYNRSLIYKMINFIDYSSLPEFKEKINDVTSFEILNIEKKLLKFFVSNQPSDYYCNLFIGQIKFNLLNRIENEYLNIIIGVPKKKMFFEKKIYLYRIFNNEKIFNLNVYSKYTRLIEIETSFMFLICYDEKDFKIKVSKYYDIIPFINSIGIIIILLIKNIFFLNKIIKFLFNNFSLTGNKVCLKYKNKIFFSNLCIKLIEKNMIKLKFLNIFKYCIICVNK